MRAPADYQVEQVLSPGPFIVVALARGPGGGECVIKAAAVDRALPMLQSEEAVLRALESAGAVGVPRVLARWSGGFAMARIALPTLREHGDQLRASGRLRNALARRAFERLAAIHGACDAGGAPLGIVHGDLSPDNIFVGPDGAETMLADFGLARWREGGAPDGGAFRGTLHYVAPEVARGETFDGSADDFALAASFLHITTGVPLRGGEGASKAGLLLEAGSRPLDASHPWRTLAPQLFDPGIADSLLACLAFDPRDRPRETPRPC